MSTNLALNRPASQSSFVLPYSGQRAVDGSISPISRWLCNSLPCFLSIDLGAIFSIDRWVVRHMAVVPGWPAPGYTMSDFRLQRSADNVIWQDVDIVAGNSDSITDRTVSPFQARYLRVLVTGGLQINPQLASILEFEVYQAPEPPPRSPSRGLSFQAFEG